MRKIYLILLLMLLSTQYVYADRNNGVYAYLQGDYETAYNIMASLANTSDDSLAQYYVGVMHMKGQGVLQDYHIASEWFRKASKQGLAVAMHKLAGLYIEGKGVPQDREFAYIWYSVATTHGHKKSIKRIEQVKSSLSADELVAAEPLLVEYIEKYGSQKN